MTPEDNDPGDDQAAAELRDLDRLIELAGPQLPANYAGPVADGWQAGQGDASRLRDKRA